MKTLEDWRLYWSGRTGVNRIELVDYCVAGVAMTHEAYMRAVVLPNLAALDVQKNCDILEIGCGTGLHLDALDQFARRLVGTDISETLLSTYKGRAETFVCAAADQPFEIASFDRVLMAGVALYFPSDSYFEDVLRLIKSLLRPNGRALIADMLFGDFISKSGYRAYDMHVVMAMLDRLEVDWQITNQTLEKRNINTRYNIVLKLSNDLS